MGTSEADIRAFFDEYRATFARFDLAALADLFTFPLQVVSAGDGAPSISVSDSDGWPAILEMLFGAYRSLGIADAKPLSLEVATVSPDVASVRVHWELLRDDDSVVYDFTAIYTVVLVDDAFRVAGVAHDELPKLAAAMGALSDG